jgi:hypothetical protein
VHISYGRRLFGLDQFDYLMLLVAIAMLGVVAAGGEPLPAIHTFADNIYNDPCDSVFVENPSCTNFLIRGSLSPSDD